MSDDPYRPLRRQTPTRGATRPTPWALIAGVVVLGVLAIAMLAILLTRGPGDGTGGGTGSPSPSAAPSETATASASAVASPTATDGEGPTAGLEPLSAVRTRVDGVTLREEPTTGGERIGTFAQGTEHIVIDGPVEADGYTWYLLSALGLPPSSGCVTPLPTDPLECPIWLGWAASGDPQSGEAWFEAVELECPDPDTETEAYASLYYRVPLHCYREEISFTAWHPRIEGGGPGESCEADESIAWLYCSAATSVVPDEGEAVAFIGLFVDPEAGIAIPEPESWLRVTGSYDHPDAPACAEANAEAARYESEELAALECRVRFVVSAVEETSAP